MYDEQSDQVPMSASDAPRLLHIVKARHAQAIAHRRSQMVLGASVETWLGRCDRMMNKVHESDQVAAFPEMKRYFGLGTMRSSATTSWMRDLLVNTGDIPISMSPTPIPELPKDEQDAVNAQMLALTAQKFASVGIDPYAPLPPAGLYNGLKLNKNAKNWLNEESAKLFKTRARAVNAKANDAMSLMKIKMTDHAVQGGWRKAHTLMLHYGNIYPFKVICGPDWIPVVRPAWVGNKYEQKAVIQPTWRAIDPRRCFFAPDASNASDGGFFIEEMDKTRAQVMMCREHDDVYNRANLDALLVDWVRSAGDHNIGDFYRGANGVLEMSNTQETVKVLRHVGEISGRELSDANITGYDAKQMYQCDIEWVAERLIKCQVVKSPSGMRGYYSSNFKRFGDSWVGASPLMYLFDAQTTLNQWQYHINSNFYASSGPMMEIHAGRMDSAADFYWNPFGSFTANSKSKVVTGESKSLEMHYTQALYGSQMAAFMQRLRLADYECGIPSEAYGPSLPVGGGQTLGEITLRWGASLRSIKDAVLNDDELIIEQTFRHLYEQLMEYDKDQNIKADAQIKATGAAGLMQREMMEAKREKLLPQLQSAAQAMPDKYGPAFEAALNEQFESMGLGDLLPEDPRTAQESNRLVQGLPGTASAGPDGRSGVPPELLGARELMGASPARM
jgi:hypothetical protein